MTATMGDLFDLTEFTFVDPESVHLVRRAANGIDSPLLAKAAEEVNEQLVKGLTDQFIENYCHNDQCEVCKGRFLVLREADPGFVEKAKLKSKQRKALPDSAFALPEKRAYPIHDENHARAALSMLHNASPEDQKRIKAAVRRRYPNIKIDGDDKVSDDTEKAGVSTDESLSQTHEMDAGPGPACDGRADDGGEPRSVSFPHGAAGDGEGDTAPDKDLHRSEAESQTAGAQTNKATVDGGGDTAPDKDTHRSEAESQTNATPAHEATGSSEAAAVYAAGTSQNQDADAVKAPFVAMDNATAIAGGAEQDADGAIRRSNEGSTLTDPTTTTSKEIEMTEDELRKMLDERDEAARRERKARKQAKKAKRAEQAEKEAADAAKGEGTDTAEDADEASKAEGAPSLEERLAKAEETLAKVAGEDGKHVAVNAAGVTALLRGTPEQRESVFKEFDERVEEAEKSGNADAIRTARMQRTAAKMIARDNARERGELPRSSRFGPNTTELFERTGSLPEDTALHGM